MGGWRRGECVCVKACPDGLEHFFSRPKGQFLVLGKGEGGGGSECLPGWLLAHFAM